MNIALGIVHNKNTALLNRQQITTLTGLLTPHYEGGSGTPDDCTRIWYSLTGLVTPNEVTVYQVVPFGVARPNNINTLNSYNVIYGNNDTNKTGDHPRFFNWLFKRATDHGAEVVAYLRFPALFGASDMDTAINRITTTRLLITRVWGTMAHVRLLRLLRERQRETLDETLTYDTALPGLRSWMLANGLEYDE